MFICRECELLLSHGICEKAEDKCTGDPEPKNQVGKGLGCVKYIEGGFRNEGGGIGNGEVGKWDVCVSE